MGVWDALIPGLVAEGCRVAASQAFRWVPACSLSNKQLDALLVESLLFSRFNARVPQNKQFARARVQASEGLGVCTDLSLVFSSNTNLGGGVLELLKMVSVSLVYSLYSEEKNGMWVSVNSGATRSNTCSLRLRSRGVSCTAAWCAGPPRSWSGDRVISLALRSASSHQIACICPRGQRADL